MIGGEESQTGAVNKSVCHFQMIVVINMVEVQKRQNAGVSAAAVHHFAQIVRAEMRF